MTSFTDYRRHKALQRALKWKKLFKVDTFDAIVTAAYAGGINPPTAFTDACDKEGMTTKEKAWLWNYLRHCGTLWDTPESDKDGVLEDAAGTGW